MGGGGGVGGVGAGWGNWAGNLTLLLVLHGIIQSIAYCTASRVSHPYVSLRANCDHVCYVMPSLGQLKDYLPAAVHYYNPISLFPMPSYNKTLTKSATTETLSQELAPQFLDPEHAVVKVCNPTCKAFCG